MDAFVIVTPYNTGKPEDCGKKFLVRMPERKYLDIGEIVVTRSAIGKECMYTTLTPDFNAGVEILQAWGVNMSTVRNVVAVLKRYDIAPEEDTTLDPAPELE